VTSVRPLDLGRAGLGVVALLRPDDVLRVTRTHDTSPAARCTVRILGARYLVQSAGGLLVRRPWTARADALVEVVHALSMVGLAGLSRPHRRAALTSAAVATGFAALDLREHYR
jgi:hypothetical protein